MFFLNFEKKNVKNVRIASQATFYSASA